MSSQYRQVLDFKGLVTALGKLQAPAGSMTAAINVLFPAPGVCKARPGFQATPGYSGQGPWAVVAPPNQYGLLLLNRGNTAGTVLETNTLTGVSTVLTLPDSSGTNNSFRARMKGASLNENTYVTDETFGPIRVGINASSAKRAGVTRAPGFDMQRLSVDVLSNFPGTLLADGASVAYRCVWVLTDDSGVEILGGPSGRIVVANVATTTGHDGDVKDVALRVKLPKQTRTTNTAITTSWTCRVYRTQTFATGTTPDDEMQLCYQHTVTAGEITATYFEFVDNCPSEALGDYLYTNTVSGGDLGGPAVAGGTQALGILASNDLPPIAHDVALFAGSMFYANLNTTTVDGRILFSFTALPANNDTLDVSGVTFTAKTAPTTNTAQFEVFSGGTLTENLRQTAINFCESVNANTSNTSVYAHYVGNDSSPGTIGKVMIEARRSDQSVSVLSSAAVGFLPDISGGTATNGFLQWPNGLAFSKPLQPDSVPPANYLRIGRSDTAIQRIVPLRDALFIFKEEGIYWLRGTSPANFSVEEFDLTKRLRAREMVAVLGDAIYAWFREGISKITSGGVELLDLGIRPTVQGIEVPLLTLDTSHAPVVTVEDDLANYGFAVGFPELRTVMFFYPNAKETINCEDALVWNELTQAWSTLTTENVEGMSCGAYRQNDASLVFTHHNGANNSYLYVMNQGVNLADYADVTRAADYLTPQVELVWSNITPQPGTLCHWQEVFFTFSTLTLGDPFGSAPTALDILLYGDGPGETVDNITGEHYSFRALVPQGVALNTTMALQLIYTRDALTLLEPFSISGVTFLYKPASPHGWKK